MLSKSFAIAAIVSSFALFACSSSRDVEVSGKVSSASIQSEVILEFFEIDGSDKTSVHTAKLSDDGTFKETVSLEGDEVLVRAVADKDANGACTEGELWAEQTAKVSDDKAGPIELTLAQAPCPKQ